MSRGLTEGNIINIQHWAHRLREAKREDRVKSGAVAFGVQGEAWTSFSDIPPIGIYAANMKGSTSDKLKVTTKSDSERESFYPGHEVNFGTDFPEYAVVGSPRADSEPGYSKGQYYQMLYRYGAAYAVSAAGAIKSDGARISKVYDFLVPDESVEFTDKSGVKVTARCELVTELTRTEEGRDPVQVRWIRFEVDGKYSHSILQFLPRDNLSIKEAAQVRLYLRKNGVDVTNKDTRAVINCADGSDRSGSRTALFHLLDQIEKNPELLRRDGLNLSYLLKLCSIMVQEQTHDTAAEAGISSTAFCKEYTGDVGIDTSRIDVNLDPNTLLTTFQTLPDVGIRGILKPYLERVQAAARSRGEQVEPVGGDLARLTEASTSSAERESDARVLSYLSAAVSNEVYYQFDHQSKKFDGLNLKAALADGKFTISVDLTPNSDKAQQLLSGVKGYFEKNFGAGSAELTRFDEGRKIQSITVPKDRLLGHLEIFNEKQHLLDFIAGKFSVEDETESLLSFDDMCQIATENLKRVIFALSEDGVPIPDNDDEPLGRYLVGKLQALSVKRLTNDDKNYVQVSLIPDGILGSDNLYSKPFSICIDPEDQELSLGVGSNGGIFGTGAAILNKVEEGMIKHLGSEIYSKAGTEEGRYDRLYMTNKGGTHEDSLLQLVAQELREKEVSIAHGSLKTDGKTVHLASAQIESATSVAQYQPLQIIRDVFSPKLRLFGYDYEGGALPEKMPADFLNVSVEEEGGVKKIKISTNPYEDESISKTYIAKIKDAMLDLGLLNQGLASAIDISGSRAEASLEFDVGDVNVGKLRDNDLGYFADVIDVLKGGRFNPSRDTVDNLKSLVVRLHEIRSFFKEKHGKTTGFTKDEMPQDLLFDLVKNFIPGFNEDAVVKTKILDQKGRGYVGPIKEEDKHCYIAFNLAGNTIADPNYPPPYTVFIDPYDLEFSLTPGSHLRGYDEKFRGVSRHLIAQDAADLIRSSRVGHVFDGFYIDAAKQQAIHNEINTPIAIQESLESAQTAQERFVAPEYTLTEGSIASLQKIMSRQKVRNPDFGFQSLYSQKGDGSFEEDLDQLISADGKRLVSICSPQGFQYDQEGGVIALSIAAMINPIDEVIHSKNSDGSYLFNIDDGEVESQRILIPLNKGGAHWDLLCIDVDRVNKKLTFSNITTDGIRDPAPPPIVDSVKIDGYEIENLSESEYYYKTGAQLGQNCGIATALMMQDQMSESLTGNEERSYNGFLNTFMELQRRLQEEKDKAIASATIEDPTLRNYAKAIVAANKGSTTVSDDEITKYLSDRNNEESYIITDKAIKFIKSNKDEFSNIGFDIDDKFLRGRNIEDLQKMILKYYLVQAIYQPEMYRIIQGYDIAVREALYRMASNESDLVEGDVQALANDIKKIAGNFDGRTRQEVSARSSVQQIYNKYYNRLSADQLYQLFITEFRKLDEGGRQKVYNAMLSCGSYSENRDKITALKKLPSGNIRELLLTPEDELKSHGRVTILDIFESHIVHFLDSQSLSVAIPDHHQELQAGSLGLGILSAGVEVGAGSIESPAVDLRSQEEVGLAKIQPKELGGGKADTSASESAEQDAILKKFRLMSGGIWDEPDKKRLANLYKALEEKITQSKHLLKEKTVTIGFDERSCYLLGNDEEFAITTNLDHIALKSRGVFGLESDIKNFINYTQRAIESIDRKVEGARVAQSKGGGGARAHTAAGSKAAMVPEDPYGLRAQAQAIKGEIRRKMAEGMDIEPHPDINAGREPGKFSPANCRLNKLSGNASESLQKTAKIFITKENLAILHDFFEERKGVEDKLGNLYKTMKFEDFILRLMNKRYKEIYLDGRALLGRDERDHDPGGPVLSSYGSDGGERARDFMDNLATERDEAHYYKEYLTLEEMMLTPLTLPQATSVIIGTGSRSERWGSAEVESEFDQSVDLALLSYPAAAEYRDGKTASYDLLFTTGFGGKDRYENHTAARKDKLRANAPLMKAAARIYGQNHSLSEGAVETVKMRDRLIGETGHQLNIAAYKARTKNTLKLILLAADHDMKKYDLGTTFALKGVGMGAFSFTGSDEVFEKYTKEALQEVMSEITFNHIKKINLISWPSVFKSKKDKEERLVYEVSGVQVVESNRPASLQKVAGEEAVAATVFCGDSGSLIGNEGNIGLGRHSSDDPAMQYSMHDPELMDPYRNPFLNRAEAISIVSDRGAVCGVRDAVNQKLEQDFLTRLGFARGVETNSEDLLTALQYAWGVFRGGARPEIGIHYDQCKDEYLNGKWDVKTFGTLAKNALLAKIKEVAPKARFLAEYEDLMVKNAGKDMSAEEYEALRVEVRSIIAAAPVEQLLMSKEERAEAEAKFVPEKSSGTIRAEQEAAERARQKALADAAAQEVQRKVEAAALKAKQQADTLEALERSKQEATDRLSALNSYLKSSASLAESQYDSNADILALTAAIDKNKNNPNPRTPYRGTGIKSDLVQYGGNQYALQITDIFPPSGGRFSKKINENLEGIFSGLRIFTDEGIIGGKITEVFVGYSYKSITDIVNESGTVESALQQIAKIFHDPHSVKFKVETAVSDEVAAGSVIEITCDNSRNSTSVFAPSASAASDFKTVSSMSDKEKLEILNGLSTSRSAPPGPSPVSLHSRLESLTQARKGNGRP